MDNNIRRVFVHIPKTGGKTVDLLLMGKSKLGWKGDHRKLSKLLRLRKRMRTDEIKNRYIFTFCRNPYDRIVSAYEYQKKLGKDTSGKLRRDAHDMEFPDFVLHACNDKIIYEPTSFHFTPQHTWLDVSAKVHVFKFENYAESIKILCDKFGVEYKDVKFNSSKRKPKSEYYQNPKVVDKVRSLYKKDFQRFNYSTNIEDFLDS